MSVIALERVGFEYQTPLGPQRVLSDVDLAFQPGQVCALVGPSGSGKSTVLLLLQGILHPTEGQVLRQGRTAWVAQDSTISSRRTVEDNAALGGLQCGFTHREAVVRAQHWLNSLGILDLASRPGWAISGGQRQRVCLARALCSDATAILLDEPTGQLDRVTARETMEVFLTACPSSCVVVAATHDESLLDLFNVVYTVDSAQHRLIARGMM